MTDWIKHDGGPIPVHPETVVRVRSIANGSTASGAASGFYWPGFGGCEYKILHSHQDCPSINERAALNQAITTAMDMTRAGIAQSEPEWRVEKHNGVKIAGKDRIEWWCVDNGDMAFKAYEPDHAQWLADKLNGKA